jgi:tRNA (guanine-N7-)-methyltransferase
MGKKKLKRWEELKTIGRVFQPLLTYYSDDWEGKGYWREKVFHNVHPVIVEAGCGKGEYTIEMARCYPDKNFIGVDIKGARLWRGATRMQELKLTNVAFLRIRLELIEKCFAPDEVDEIWLTFPDPQPKKSRENRRLTAPAMLSRFRNILKNGGLLHLKTDNLPLMHYTLDVLNQQPGKLLVYTFDVDTFPGMDQRLGIVTTYEKMYRREGKKIAYLCFQFQKE